jgi:hypothetical protein
MTFAGLMWKIESAIEWIVVYIIEFILYLKRRK